MPQDLAAITGGAAIIEVADVNLGHTQGGISVKVSPKTRQRKVDAYGESVVDVIHIGDEAMVTAPLAQWSAEVIQEVFQVGDADEIDDATTPVMGIGRKAGAYYEKKKVEVIPISADDDTKKIELFKCCPIGEVELSHTNEDDRIYNLEMAACIDETQTDGNYLGKIYVGFDRGTGSE